MKYKEISVFTTEAGLDAVCARFSMLGMEQLEIVQGREEIADFLQKSAKYWDFADMDELCAAEPCVKAYIDDDDAADAAVAACTTQDMTQEQKLRACYEYVRDFKYLGRNAALPRTVKTMPHENAVEYARKIFETGKGDCYNFAASFCFCFFSFLELFFERFRLDPVLHHLLVHNILH